MPFTMATASTVERPLGFKFGIIYLNKATTASTDMVVNSINVENEKLTRQQIMLLNNFDHDYIEVSESDSKEEKIDTVGHDHDYCFYETVKRKISVQNENSQDAETTANTSIDTIKQDAFARYEKLCQRCREKVEKDLSLVNCDKCNLAYVFICKSCNETFEDYSKLSCHLKFVCNPFYLFSCTYCNYTANSEFKVGNHVKAVHRNENSTFVCQFCKKLFDEKLEFLKHINVCRRFLPSNGEVEKAQRERKKIIEERKKIVKEKERLKREEQKLDKQRKRLAKKREKLNYGRWKERAKELRLKHSNKNAYLKFQNKYCCRCQVPSENNSNDSASVQNLEKCQECKQDLFWQCTACLKIYSVYSSMMSHLIRTFVKNPDYFRCLMCGFTTQFECSMRNHIKNIHKIGQKCFAVDHVRHDQLKDWVANCDSSVYIKVTDGRIRKDLSKIILIQCPKCKEVRKGGYRRCYKCRCKLDFECLKCGTKDTCSHLEAHKESIKFACHFCGKTFIAFGNYYAHELLCSKREQINCDHCGFYSKFKSSMRNHMLSMHKHKIV